jgi:ubiquitin C-terminal hydrolase
VKGHCDVTSALREYVEDAVLDGDNKYQLPNSTERVDAVKQTRFVQLPPVLHLHLMRFTYNSTTGVKEKINSVSQTVHDFRTASLAPLNIEFSDLTAAL